MAPTSTPNLNLIKPDLQSEDIWGETLNDNFDKIDSAVQDNENNLVTVSGHLQDQIDNLDVDETEKALVGAGNVTVTSGTSTITISGSNTELTTVSGHLQDQIDVLDTSVRDPAIIGTDGITIISGSSTITIDGFRTEFISASGSLQTQIDDIDVDEADVSSLNTLQGDITLSGSNGIQVTEQDNFIILDGLSISGTTTSSGIYTHIQDVPATEWVVEHNLNTEEPVWAAYKTTGNAFLPEEVVISGSNALRVFVDPAIDGIFKVALGGGLRGLQGIQGLQGPQGIQGPIGISGTMGISGTIGISGSVGNTGPQGIQGPIGISGTTGPQGLQGEQGPTGISGAVGPQGPQGSSGILAAEESQVIGIEFPTEKTYPVDPFAYFSYTIDTAKVVTSAGNGIFSIEINDVGITGMTSKTFNTSFSTHTATSGNQVSEGDRVTLVFSFINSVGDFEMALKLTRD